MLSHYDKISKLNRSIAATLLLLVFMALVMADEVVSLFGIIILGTLLLQFALEARMFFRSQKKRNT